MNGRGVLSLCVRIWLIAALVAPLVTDAQTAKLPRIGVLRAGAPPDPNVDGFKRGLRELGYIEGRNILLEYRWAEGRLERLPALAAELVQLKVDIIFTGGVQATEAAVRASKTIPVVTGAVGSPNEGFVASYARPGGNLTGLSVVNEELSAKRIELLREVLPNATRIAVLGVPSPGTEAAWKALQDAAQRIGAELNLFAVRAPGELEQAFARMAQWRPDALITLPDELFFAQRKRVVDLAEKNRVPGIFDNAPFVHAGGLMAYGPNFPDLFRRGAIYVDKILKGAKPADLPIERPTHFELVISLKAAKALGVTIPKPVVVRADLVVE